MDIDIDNSKNISDSNAKSKLTKSTFIESKELYKNPNNPNTCELNKGYSTSSSLLQKRSKWTKDEDNKLLNLRNNNYNWKDISLQLNKDQKKCIYRYKRLTNEKSLKWLMEDDTLLLQLTSKYGEKFSEFTSYFHNRSEREIAERYKKIKLFDNITFTQEEDNFLIKVYSNREDLGLIKKSNLSLMNNQEIDSDILMDNSNKNDSLIFKDNSFLKFGKDNNKEIQTQLKSMIHSKGVRNVRKRIETLLNVKGEDIDISFNISSILSSTLSSQSTNNNLSGLSNIAHAKNEEKLNRIEEELYSNKNYYEDDSFAFFNKQKKIEEDILIDEDSNKKLRASDTSINNSSAFDNIEKDIFYLIDNNNNSSYFDNNAIDNDFFNNYEDLNISETENFFKLNDNKFMFETNDDEIFNSKDIKEFFEKDLQQSNKENDNLFSNNEVNVNTQKIDENLFKKTTYNKKYSHSSNNIMTLNLRYYKKDSIINNKNNIFKISKVKDKKTNENNFNKYFMNSYKNVNQNNIENSNNLNEDNDINIYSEFFNNKNQYFEDKNNEISNNYQSKEIHKNLANNHKNYEIHKKQNENNKEKQDFLDEVNKIKDIDKKITFLLEKNSQLFTILNKSKEISDCFSMNVKSKINNFKLHETNKNTKFSSFIDLFQNLDSLEVANNKKYDEKLLKLKKLALNILTNSKYTLNQEFFFDNLFIKEITSNLNDVDSIIKDSFVRNLIALTDLFFNTKKLIKLKMKLLKGIYS